ncbi:MAG TPA: ribonuclease Y [Phycisphaerae bacterium]|nr:ribonuclease Y [Phycisphaerae bacterium]
MFSQQLVLAMPDSAMAWAAALLGSAVVGGAAVLAFFHFLGHRERAARQAEAQRLIADAQERSAAVLRAAEIEAQKKALEAMERFEQETAETRNELRAAERRLDKREDTLVKKEDVLTTKERKLEGDQAKLAEQSRILAEKTTQVDSLLAQQRTELLRIARLSPDQARSLCLKQVEREVEKEAGQLVERIINNAEENAREKARYIIVSAIQRYAAEHTCETVVATVDVPSDEMKGRIIGREGRNIRAFEKTTGVTVIVDDTPGIVQVSCFDPVRKEIARQSLDQLIRDGRIHPTRIEEVVAEVTKEVEERVVVAGREAAATANVSGVNKKILDVLGRLQFRTSYGQNVLKHCVEVAYLSGLMADELGLDGALARRCGLLHDLGKALDHEAEGSHTKVGYEFARRFNEPPAVLNAIQGHHGDVAATHPYTPLVSAADAISAARPGSRRESIERYIKRLQELEAIATSFSGVRQAYAIEAGREVRVIVDAERVDDRSSLKLARDVAHKIEEDVATFPGEIKVTVLREVRATEYAISGRHRGNGDRAAEHRFIESEPEPDEPADAASEPPAEA